MRNLIYISNSGNDTTGNGSLASPYATLAKASSVTLSNMFIYLDKGSVFINDKLSLSGKNNITLDSYGSGNAPILRGLKSLTGWINEGGNIWSKQDSTLPTEITNLFIGGVRALLGKSAVKTATSGSSSTLSDTALSEADGFYDNAELVIKYWDWSRGISRVSSYASKTFTFPIYYQDEETDYAYTVSAGKTYWIQNHRNLLTAQNQWAYNNITKTVYIYSTVSPSGVTCTYGDDCIIAESCKYLTIKNISIDGACKTGININLSSYVLIDNIDFTYSGIYSIYIRETKTVTIQNCSGIEQNNDFVNISKSNNIKILDNYVSKCGMVAEQNRYMPVFSRGGTAGITVMLSDNILVRGNEVGHTAYIAIGVYYGHKFLVEKNYVHHFTYNKYDGGGIYIVTGSRWFIPTRNIAPTTDGRVLRNIATDGRPTQNSSGIYFDNYTQEFECAYNFCSGSRYNLHLHENLGLNVHHNTLVAENGSTTNLYHTMTNATSIRSIIENNTLISKTTAASSVYVNVSSVRTHTYKDNTYYFPLGKLGTGTNNTINKIASSWYNLAQWVADESRVVWTRTGETEITDPVNTGTVPTNKFVEYFINPTGSSIEVASTDLPYGDYINLNGSAISFPVTVSAYGSVVFVRDPSDAPSTNISFTLTATGTGAGVSYLRLEVSEDITITLDGTAKFYDDAGGTVNEGTTRTVTYGAWRDFYLKCPYGTANLTFSNILKVTQIRAWTGTTNCPSISGDLSRVINSTYFGITGNNTLSGDISNLLSITTILCYGNNTLTGDPKEWTLADTIDIRGSSTMAYSSFVKLKNLANITVHTTTTLTSANVNQLLADVKLNIDGYRSATDTRSINLQGSTSSGAPTGQGIADKAYLQAYRTPGNDSSKNLWTVTTR